jgi:hypothetical protein
LPFNKNSVLLNEKVFFEVWADSERAANSKKIINKKDRNEPFDFFIDH